MKRSITILFVVACAAWAANVDGKWASEMKMRAGKKGGAARVATMSLDLKSDGSRLTGTVIAPGKKRSRSMAIEDGKIDGDHFSFTTVERTKRGETKSVWQGTVQGNQITGTVAKERAAATAGKAKGKGRHRGTPFTATRQG